MIHELTVPVGAAGVRLDVWLESQLPSCTRSLIARLIKEGRCTIHPGQARAGRFLTGGEVVTLEVPSVEPIQAAPEDIPLSILHWDEHIVVVDKPAGMVVHPAIGHVRGTLVNALLGKHGQGLDQTPWRPGLVHRLDAETSGVMVVARTGAALAFLQDAFRNRTTKKRYLALVAGKPRADFLENGKWIARHPQDFRKRTAVKAPPTAPPTAPAETPPGPDVVDEDDETGFDASAPVPAAAEAKHDPTLPPDAIPVPDEPRGGGRGQAREAYTSVVVLQRHDGYAVVEARPRTGRTHQVRVHLADLGHPILADGVYGRSRQWPLNAAKGDETALRRHGLHAWTLEIPHPGGGWREYQAPIPADMRRFITGTVTPRPR
jgi:23S rRNA pseudouridine1911/1915/1917 synthase